MPVLPKQLNRRRTDHDRVAALGGWRLQLGRAAPMVRTKDIAECGCRDKPTSR